MSSLSPATTLALFQPSSGSSGATSSASLDMVTQRLAEQVADGKLSMEQGTALAQAWQQIEDVVSVSSGRAAEAFGPGDITQMFDALRPALTQLEQAPPVGSVDILA